MDKGSFLPSIFGKSVHKGHDIFSQLQHEVDRVFDHFSLSRPVGGLNGDSAFEPAVDISETSDAIDVMAEIPGCEPKDVDISLVGRTLTLRGEKKTEKEQKEKDFHSIERSYGSFMRSIQLPYAIDPAKVEASFDKGVLKVHLPKPPEAKQEIRKIPIKG